MADTTTTSLPDPAELEAQAAPSTLEGWGTFRRAINVTLPNLLSQAEALNATTRRLLGLAGQ